MKGVDLSHYQKGLTIRQLRDAGRDFAILKLTEGSGLADSAAFDFYREARELGFPVGGYCYSHAQTPEEARSEARFLLETVRGFPLPCGVFLDMEEARQLALPREKLRGIVNAWCAEIGAAGYAPGVYGSEGNLWAKVKPEELPAGTLVWAAHYGKEPDMPCDLWQSSDRGRVAGYDGPVDTDEARSKRFQALAEAPPQSPAPTAPPEGEPRVDPSVMLLQLLMNYNGCWGSVDGIPSAAFFAALRAFTDRLEGER